MSFARAARRAGLVSWTSVLALSFISNTAHAECAPVPPGDGASVVCTGGFTGFTTDANNISVDVQGGGLTSTDDVVFGFTGDDISFTNQVFLGGAVTFAGDGDLDFVNGGGGAIQTSNGDPAVLINGANSLDFTNNGTIQATTENAAMGATPAAVSITQTDVGGAANADEILNAGIITVNGANGIAVSIEGDAAEFTNSGTVSVTNADSTAVIIRNAAGATNGMMLTNTANGTISAGFGADAVMLFGDVVVDNAGFITAGVDAIPRGAIIGDDGVQDVTNSGAVVGNVDLGAGDDMFSLEGAGTVSGQLNGGLGTDFLDINTTTDSGITGVSGFETIEKRGAGTTFLGTVNGVDTLDIFAGGLDFNGTIDGDVTVAAGASLSGTGGVDGNLTVDGTFTPNPDAGSFTIGGDLTLSNTSTLAVGFSDGGTAFSSGIAGMIEVDGTATLGGGTFTLAPTDLPIGVFSFDYLTADGGITGDFTTTTPVSNYRILGMDITGNTASIEVKTQLGENLNLSEEAQQVASFLQQYIDDGDGSTSTLSIIRNILALPDADQEAAYLDLFTPQPYTSYSTLAISQSLTVADIVRDSAGSKMGGRGPFFGWATPFGSLQKIEGDGVVRTWDHDTTVKGVISGGGMNFNDNASFGFFVGTSKYDQEFKSNATITEGSSLIFGGFIMGRWGPVTLTALGSYDQADLDTRRVQMTLDEETNANYKARTTMGSAAMTGTIGEKNWIIFEPRVQATYISTDRDRVIETGSDNSLIVGEQRRDAFYIDLGAKLGLGAAAGHMPVKPHVVAGWRQDLITDDDITPVALTNEPDSFSFTGPAPDESHAYVGLGLTSHLSKAIDVNFEYRSEFGETSTRHVLTGGVVVKFGAGR